MGLTPFQVESPLAPRTLCAGAPALEAPARHGPGTLPGATRTADRRLRRAALAFLPQPLGEPSIARVAYIANGR